MNSGLDFAIFLSAYFVPFFFRTNRYPYVTCEENAFEIRFLNELSFHQWVWTLLFPILIAVLLPTIILIYTLTSFLNINSTYDKFYILNYFITITIFLINNLSFLWFIKHNGEKE
ncbi:MAG: hypothetical protein KAG14_04325, partial [Mycoplasmataceae bacterium]|nr:hypothetical protein [Mycoplasmataceae bacterium]